MTQEGEVEKNGSKRSGEKPLFKRKNQTWCLRKESLGADVSTHRWSEKGPERKKSTSGNFCHAGGMRWADASVCRPSGSKGRNGTRI